MGLCKPAQGELVVKANWESVKEASQPQISFYMYGAKNQPCMLVPWVSLSPSTAQGFGAGGSMSSIVLHLTPLESCQHLRKLCACGYLLLFQR